MSFENVIINANSSLDTQFEENLKNQHSTLEKLPAVELSPERQILIPQTICSCKKPETVNVGVNVKLTTLELSPKPDNLIPQTVCCCKKPKTVNVLVQTGNITFNICYDKSQFDVLATRFRLRYWHWNPVSTACEEFK